MTIARWVEIRPGVWVGYKRKVQTVDTMKLLLHLLTSMWYLDRREP